MGRLHISICLGSLLLLMGCASDRSVISQASEVNKGLQPAIMTDKELVNYIESLGQRIVTAAQAMDKNKQGPESHVRADDNSWMFKDMEFHFVNSKTLNAFTTGGKHMYIYTELLATCKNEDELAAVMSHEYAHVYCRHVAQGQNRQYAILGTAAALGVAGAAVGYNQDEGQGALTYGAAAGGAAAAMGSYFGMGWTRDDENEADKFGFQFYCRAGWDPQRFAGFFQTLIDRGLDKTPEAMSDHPKLSNRVANTRRRISELPASASNWRRPPIADDAQFHAIQARAVQLGKTMKNDKSLQQAQLMLAAFPSCVSPEDQPDQKQAQAVIYNAKKKQK